MNFGRLRFVALALSAVMVSAQPVSAQESPQMPPPVVDGQGRAVLVTGASTGFGRRLTELLSEHNWTVYAGARKPEDIAALGAMKNVHPLKLDVTVQSDVDAAVAEVKAGGKGLFGLVNNAGVAVMTPVALMDEADYDYVMETNVKGPWRIIPAFDEPDSRRGAFQIWWTPIRWRDSD